MRCRDNETTNCCCITTKVSFFFLEVVRGTKVLKIPFTITLSSALKLMLRRTFLVRSFSPKVYYKSFLFFLGGGARYQSTKNSLYNHTFQCPKIDAQTNISSTLFLSTPPPPPSPPPPSPPPLGKESDHQLTINMKIALVFQLEVHQK